MQIKISPYFQGTFIKLALLPVLSMHLTATCTRLGSHMGICCTCYQSNKVVEKSKLSKGTQA